MANKWIPWNERTDCPELFVVLVWKNNCNESTFLDNDGIKKIKRIITYSSTVFKIARIPNTQKLLRIIKRSLVLLLHDILLEDGNDFERQYCSEYLEKGVRKDYTNDIGLIKKIELLSFSELSLYQQEKYADYVIDLEDGKENIGILMASIINEYIQRLERTEKIIFDESQLEAVPADDGSVADVQSAPAPADSRRDKATEEQLGKETEKQDKARKPRVAITDDLKLKAGKLVRANPDLTLDELSVLLNVSRSALDPGENLRIVIDSAISKERKKGRKISKEEGGDDYYLEG